ncbi:MAG: ABC transporter substrate binding protein [Gemmatimonadota bacterium]|nr:ABC transporter substrate binding protein [Gemmatimonadota bacterium]
MFLTRGHLRPPRCRVAVLALVLTACGGEAPAPERPVIGLMQVAAIAPLEEAKDGFLQALADSGYVADSTITILERNAQGDIPTLSLIANEFKQRGVTHVATLATVTLQSAMKVITDRPLIFGAVANPYLIGAGTTPTDHRPNVTGADIPLPVDKSLAVAIEVFPAVKTWGTLYDPSDPFAEFYIGKTKAAAAALGVKLVIVACTSPSDIVTGVQTLRAQGAQGIMQIPSVMIVGGMPAMVKATRDAGMPFVSASTGTPGPPVALGASFRDNGYDMGLIMIRVLRGTSPATIPFQSTNKARLDVDLAAAKRYEVVIPQAVIDRADNVVPASGAPASGAPASGAAKAGAAEAGAAKATPAAPAAPSDSPWALWWSTLAQGLAYVALAWGVYLSSRVLRFPDITPDGSFPLGAAVAAAMILGGVHPVLATLAAFVVGMAAGYLTGVLHTRFGVTELLTGILVMTGLYSVNLRVMGRSNLSMLDQPSVATTLHDVFPMTAGWSADLAFGLLFAAMMVVLGLVLVWYLRTDFGLAMRAVGDNPAMITAQGVDRRRMVELGLALANGLVAFSGALIAQYQGFADVGMGVGTLVGGMAAVILGETLKPKRWGLGATIIMVALGALGFRALIAVALRIGLNPVDLKLATAVFVLAALVLPKLRSGASRTGATR